ncbi:transposase [Streptomyces sp. NPDC057909]|uniref:transposase n=1 Tax=Streptomyces sp. NPDC057909 TaxID=3346277 RepID=UPI0036DFBD46
MHGVWEYLPHDFPPYKTVYDYYAKWEADSTTEQVHDLLRAKTRRAHGGRNRCSATPWTP